MDVAVFALATLVAVGVSLYLFALSRVDELKKNWMEYRCNPIYMPLAGFVGESVSANFTKCTMKGFQDYAGFVMDPLMAQFSLVNDTLGEVTGNMNSMRSMMGEMRGGFLGIVGSVFGKIQNLTSHIQYIMIRMRTLMSRIVGVMITFAAIAAAGEVNVNSIAPGIAAALVATVAGLAVAIPALFGYNWLASQIKNISADSQVFVDEFITKAAELHAG